MSYAPMHPDNPPELLLQLSCAEAPTTIKKVEISKYVEEWGEDKQPAVECKLTMESGSRQIVPEQYEDVVEQLKSVALQGPEDKSNSVAMTIRHEMKRSTYTVKREGIGGRPLKFSGVPKSPRLTVDREKVALKWRCEATIPAGRLLDLLCLMICEDVVVTIESLQVEMWSH